MPRGRLKVLFQPAWTPELSKRLLKPPLGTCSATTRLALPRGSRATSCVTGRSLGRSRMLLEESVLGYTCALWHCALLHTTPYMDVHGLTLVYIYIYIWQSVINYSRARPGIPRWNWGLTILECSRPMSQPQPAVFRRQATVIFADKKKPLWQAGQQQQHGMSNPG